MPAKDLPPKDLRYAPTHEWAKTEGDVCTMGITQFAVEQLTDVVFVELPDVGDPVFSNDDFGEIESVKAVSPLYAPVEGEVVAINDALTTDPAPIAQDPYGKGWMVKIKVKHGTTLDKMLTAEQYQKQIEGQAH